MRNEVVMPSVGVGMQEGILLRWYKGPGDRVSRGEAIAEIETDKAAMDLESPFTGVVGPHLVQPDALVPVGTVLTTVNDEAQ
jgi:pyruvate/2-oxoglutarate dehydrogenase complex dihydrolipoamide acyltransferase (E2) component